MNTENFFLPITFYDKTGPHTEEISVPERLRPFYNLLVARGFSLTSERLTTGNIVFYISHNALEAEYFIDILDPTSRIDEVYLARRLEILTADGLDNWLTRYKEATDERNAERASGIPPEYKEQ